MEMKDFTPKVIRMVLKGFSNKLKCEFLLLMFFLFDTGGNFQSKLVLTS